MDNEIDDEPSGTASSRPRVEDAMGPAITVPGDATLQEVASLMLERQVQVVLVVDDDGEVRGAISEQRLTLDPAYLRMASVRVPRIRGRWVTQRDELEAACVAAQTVTTRELMETRLTSADVGEPLGGIVERMLRRGEEYAVVRRGPEVVGVLSRHDLLRHIAGRAPAAHSARTDADPGAAGAENHVVRFASVRPRHSVAQWLLAAWR